MRVRLQPPTTPAAIGGLSHGNHLAVGMALGFLFMGGGTQTFGTSNEAVAALVIALFPHFPMNSTDNRCHLQVTYTCQDAPDCQDVHPLSILGIRVLGLPCLLLDGQTKTGYLSRLLPRQKEQTAA